MQESPRSFQKSVTSLCRPPTPDSNVVAGDGPKSAPNEGRLRRTGITCTARCARMARMLQCDQPDDFVVASGVAHSLEEFAATAFADVGLNWRDYVDYDSSLTRSSDIHALAQRSLEGSGGAPLALERQIVRDRGADGACGARRGRQGIRPGRRSIGLRCTRAYRIGNAG